MAETGMVLKCKADLYLIPTRLVLAGSVLCFTLTLGVTSARAADNIFLDRVGIGTSAPAYGLDVSTSAHFSTTTTAGYGLYLSAGGQFGIGDASPASLLTVGTGGAFQVDSTGNPIKIKNITYSWPGAQGGVNTLLTNDGSGNLTWGTVIDNLGSHIATTTLDMGTFDINSAGSITANAAVTASSFTATNTTGAGLVVNSGAYLAASGGFAGIGTTAPQVSLDSRGTVGVFKGITGIGILNAAYAGIGNLTAAFQNNGNDYWGIGYVGAGNNAYALWQDFIKTRSTDGTTSVSVQAGDELGRFNYYGDDGAALVAGAALIVSVDGAPDSGSMPGKFSFFTTPSGSATPLERLTIKNSGAVGVGATNPGAALDILSTGTAVNQFAQIWRDSGNNIISSMSATGVLMAKRFVGNGSGLTDVPGDNLGSHIATTTLQMAGFGVNSSSAINAAYYQISGTSTVLAVLPGAGSLGVGLRAGEVNTNINNTFAGYQAGRINTSANSTFIGWNAGYGSTSGDYNTFVVSPLFASGYNTTGRFNTSVGVLAGYWTSSGENNTYAGGNAGMVVTLGSANAILGRGAGYATASAYVSSSTIAGAYAGYLLSTGKNNIFLGYRAGYNTNTGSDNVVIGYMKDTSAAGAASELNIGGVLFGKLDEKTIGISTRIPQAALDVVSTGTAVNQFAQLWRDSTGLVVGSMSATGVLMAKQFVGNGFSDNLGSHIATTTLQMGAFGVNSSSAITAAYYQINGITMLAAPGTNNIFMGKSGQANTTGADNIFIGDSRDGAGSSNTTGSINAFIGNWAGAANTTGHNNISIGYGAGYANTEGSYNTGIGYIAGANTTGNNNAFIGAETGSSNTTGESNVFIGQGAGYSNTTGFNNAFIGSYAGQYNTTGANNTSIGYAAGYRTESDNNAVVGVGAGMSSNTGGNNIVIGFLQDFSGPAAADELNIGGVLFGNLSEKTIGISTRIPQAALDVVSTGTAVNQFAQLWRDSTGLVVGSMSATGVLMAKQFIGGVGDNLGSHIATTTLQMGAFGVNSSSAINAAYYQMSGTSTVLAVLPGAGSLGVGIAAGRENTNINNTFVGYLAGQAVNNSAANSTYIGRYAGYGSTSGDYNTFVAPAVASNGYNVTAGSNTFVGFLAGLKTTSGMHNVYAGMQAGYNNITGSGNAILGRLAGLGTIDTTFYSSSTISGYQAGYRLTTGNNNIFLGYRAGYNTVTGSNNIVIGYAKDPSATTISNELNIGGVLYGNQSAKVIGIGQTAPNIMAALDVVSTGTAVNQFAQIWRDSDGAVVSSMSATGVLMAKRFVGGGAGLTGVSGIVPVYNLAQINTLVPQARGRRICVADAAAPYSYCVSTGTAAGAWVLLNQTLRCQ